MEFHVTQQSIISQKKSYINQGNKVLNEICLITYLSEKWEARFKLKFLCSLEFQNMAAPLYPGPLCYSLFPLHFSSQALSFMMRGLVYTHVGTPIYTCSCIFIPHPIPPLPKPLLLDHAWNTGVHVVNGLLKEDRLRGLEQGIWGSYVHHVQSTKGADTWSPEFFI